MGCLLSSALGFNTWGRKEEQGAEDRGRSLVAMQVQPQTWPTPWELWIQNGPLESWVGQDDQAFSILHWSFTECGIGEKRYFEQEVFWAEATSSSLKREGDTCHSVYTVYSPPNWPLASVSHSRYSLPKSTFNPSLLDYGATTVQCFLTPLLGEQGRINVSQLLGWCHAFDGMITANLNAHTCWSSAITHCLESTALFTSWNLLGHWPQLG